MAGHIPPKSRGREWQAIYLPRAGAGNGRPYTSQEQGQGMAGHVPPMSRGREWQAIYLPRTGAGNGPFETALMDVEGARIKCLCSSSNILAEKRSQTPPFSFTIHFRARPTPSDVCTTPFFVEHLPLKSRTPLPTLMPFAIESMHATIWLGNENEITFNRKSNVSALHSINYQIFTLRKSTLALYKRMSTCVFHLCYLVEQVWFVIFAII